MNNDARLNAEIRAKLVALQDRADQQPVSYIQLFREAMDIAEDQWRRAMAAEARLHRLEK